MCAVDKSARQSERADRRRKEKKEQIKLGEKIHGRGFVEAKKTDQTKTLVPTLDFRF